MFWRAVIQSWKFFFLACYFLWKKCLKPQEWFSSYITFCCKVVESKCAYLLVGAASCYLGALSQYKKSPDRYEHSRSAGCWSTNLFPHRDGCLACKSSLRPGSPALLSYDPVGCVTNVSLPDYAWYVQQDLGHARLIVLTLLASCPFLRRRPDGKDEGQELAAAACASYEPPRRCRWHMIELSLVPLARAASRMSACPILPAEQAVFTAGSMARLGGTARVCEAAAEKCQPCIRTEACRASWASPGLMLCLPCSPFNQFPLFSLIPSGFWLNSLVASRNLWSLWLMALLTNACMWEEQAVMGSVVDVLYPAMHLLKTQQECPLWGLHFFPWCLFNLLLFSLDFPSFPGPMFAGVSPTNC